MEADEAHIRSIPWCASLISGPNIVILPTESRAPKTSTEDALFAQTLKTPDTISGCLTFYEQPGSSSASTSAVAPINKISTLVSLGSGVNGYPHVAHGGLVATLVDEIMGLLLSVNKHPKVVFPDIGRTVTAYLNITYLKPVATPSTILVSAQIKEITGRKIFVRASVEDRWGVALARAEALWIRVDKEKEKL
ncbi:Verlamelin biosynthesis protein B [Lachnellula subtilissima]|uniref:Verlamelin biosynthesis protein B n=1 Tax=Lachnellula subtilissima TaxID=602034 RepID=A0A8H8U653_9HELO|nr:Verlamelin biosynthesis protein B [Lachnellula subtilissima]